MSERERERERESERELGGPDWSKCKSVNEDLPISSVACSPSFFLVPLLLFLLTFSRYFLHSFICQCPYRERDRDRDLWT